MKFTVIMQSLLADYPNSATNKPEKFIRAVASVINQTYDDWELIIIADGCQVTIDTFFNNFDVSDKLRLFLYEKQEHYKSTWPSYCRNVGIEKATGDYILYLDIDDFYEPDYLWNLSEVVDGSLSFVDDIVLHNEKQIRKCNLKRWMCGTSIVVHKPCKSRWPAISRYAHEDYAFIESLVKEFPDYKILSVAGYVVGHIPKKYDK